MSETLDLNNLTLQDNSHETVNEGDYHFTVISHEIGYYSGNSDKIPANTQQIICYLEIPTESGVVKVKHTMNVYSKVLFAIRNFVECIGLCGEKGAFKLNVDEIDGKSGIGHFIKSVGNNGNEYNSLETAYSPSKVPTVTDNDEAWKKYQSGGFVPNNEALPFEQ